MIKTYKIMPSAGLHIAGMRRPEGDFLDLSDEAAVHELRVGSIELHQATPAPVSKLEDHGDPKPLPGRK